MDPMWKQRQSYDLPIWDVLQACRLKMEMRPIIRFVGSPNILNDSEKVARSGKRRFASSKMSEMYVLLSCSSSKVTRNRSVHLDCVLFRIGRDSRFDLSGAIPSLPRRFPIFYEVIRKKIPFSIWRSISTAKYLS